MSFANINIGTFAGDNTGDPLRTAFDKINKNFANIAAGNINVTVNSPVQSVAGRTGNVIININDVNGAVSIGRLTTTVNAANLAARNYVDSSINSLINSAPGTLDTLAEIAEAIASDESTISALTGIINTATLNQNAANVVIINHSERIDVLEGNAYLQQVELRTLTNNSTAQATAIDNINNQIDSLWTDAEEQNSQIVSLQSATESLTSNAATQSTAIAFLNGNATVQATAINQLRANITAANAVIAQHTISIEELLTNAASQTTDINTLIANASAQSNSLTNLVANAGAQADSLTALTETAITFSESLTELSSNAATQATELTSLVANASTQATSLTTLTANASAQAESLTALFGNAIAQAESLTALVGNAVTQAESIDSINANVTAANLAIQSVTTAWTANAAVQATAIDTLTANAATQATAIGTLTANATTQATAIGTINNTIDAINQTVAEHETALSTGPISITGNVEAGNVSVVGGVYFPDGTVQTTAAVAASTGNIVFTGDTIGSVENGDKGITINASGNGEVVISDNLGINNTNPAYALDIGNTTENYNNNGAVGFNFWNGLAEAGNYKGSAVVGWDWYDLNEHGSNFTDTQHARFGIFKGDTTFGTHAWIAFDKDAPADSITVDANGLVKADKVTSTVFTSNVQIRKTEIESNAPSAVEPVDVLTATQWLHTTNSDQDFVLNIRGSNTVTLNDALEVGRSVSVTYTVLNGSTPYVLTGIQIDGVVQTVRYLGGSVPSGNPNGTDSYTVNIVKIGDASYSVTVSQQKYS